MKPDVLVGMGGWALPAFDGTFYPPDAGKGFSKLEYYSRFFDMVEVNATFYTVALGPKQVQRWLTEVSGNKDFVFTVKLYQGFTHKRNGTAEDAQAILSMVEPLNGAGRMGGLVLQFPHSFVRTKENQQHLEKLAKVFGSLTLFVEVRHDSWNSPDAFQFLRDHRYHLVNVDLPAIKRHMPLTSEAWSRLAYFRLMGRNATSWESGKVEERYKYSYSKEELEDFVKRIEAVGGKADRTFVVFHNDPNAHSPVNGFQLRRAIDPKRRLVVPESLVQHFPELPEMTGAEVLHQAEKLPLVVRRANAKAPKQ